MYKKVYSGSVKSSPTDSGKNNYYTTKQPTPTTGASTSTALVIKIANATVAGKAETILTDAHGLTLYHLTSDTKTTTACSSICTSLWPPLLVSDAQKPSSEANLSGKLTVASNANGQQVQYNGHFLYTYAGDTAPGQTNGNGIEGKWFVATANLA